jgi:hypothetical protein
MRAAFAVLVLAAACGDATPPGFSTGPAITSVSASTSGGSTVAGTTSTGMGDDSADSSGSTSTSTGTLRDVGTAVDFGVGQPPGCKGKVDLLFVVSRFYTMRNVQEQLVASFPGFVETIEDKLKGFDVHIMTANPDATWPGWACETQPDLCPKVKTDCGSSSNGYQCNVYPDLWKPCDEELGAGLTFNVGSGAANERCDLYGGNRYIISGEPNMPHALECIAKVGWLGPDPPMGEALVAALSTKLNGPDGCNAGFLREDALLVVVIISDTFDEASFTWPHQWYDKIIAAKKDASAVVMLGVVPQPHVEGQPYIPGCIYHDLPNEKGKLRDLIDRFPYRAYGDTCAPSYAPFFADATNKIAEACGAFIPQ